MEIILLYFANKYNGDWNKIFEALENKEKATLDELRETEKQALEFEAKGLKWITLLNREYPEKLKHIYKPPFVLYYKGDLKLLSKNQNTMISTTNNVDQNESIKWAKNLATKSTVVLSTALDNDAFLRKTLDGKDKVLVSNKGIQNFEIQKNELIISEVFSTKSALPTEYSTRLAAGISDKLVLVSSKEEVHNSLISDFLNLGRDIEAFTRDANSNDFNNELIKQGATAITSIKPEELQKTPLEKLKTQVKESKNQTVKKDLKQKLN